MFVDITNYICNVWQIQYLEDFREKKWWERNRKQIYFQLQIDQPIFQNQGLSGQPTQNLRQQRLSSVQASP